jgi:outer membrane protein assembly factor BamB
MSLVMSVSNARWGRARAAGRVVGLLVVAVLAGCASDKPKPTPLEVVTPKIAGRQVWQASVGTLGFPMRVAVRDGRFVAAGGDGTVLALEAATGRELWRASVGQKLSAGVGSDGRYAAVVTAGNEVVTLDAGRELWRARLPARTVTPPLVAGERVFVMTVDRAVHAFDAIDGRRLWVLQRNVDALTLSQPGVLTAVGDTLVVGQGPRLTGVDPLQGTVRWEVPMASPRGTNEVERLADLVGPPMRLGNTLCVRAFQSTVGCADASRGALLWTRNLAGAQSVGGGGEVLVGADASDRISAYRQRNGDLAWTNESLKHRDLSGFLGAGRSVVVGDLEGQVHFLDRDSGQITLRLPTDGSPVIGAPVAAGTTLLVATRNGGLFAFRPE